MRGAPQTPWSRSQGALSDPQKHDERDGINAINASDDACDGLLEDLKRWHKPGTGELRIPSEAGNVRRFEAQLISSYGASPAASCAEIGSSR